MVNFITSLTFLLTAATSVAAIPQSLEARSDTTCRDDLGDDSFGSAADAVYCINYLASLNQACVGHVSGQAFCKRGTTQITGLTLRGTSSSSCKDVARGAGLIMDKCTKPDGRVKGANPAWGNGNLIIDIRHV
ncbi:hypothetical protein FIE12Z_6599 [Fusarium flagelliforme]|uniref:Uncharacterized protein n=1 Tax=Fusarium flagelliforme TaxID=2675880 RepID=A0A395MMJ9_9HYPO|nr:hypothetical protein FIE12Z_6599 [Fusarium flagelliforme]